jgi:hypothetical protein
VLLELGYAIREKGWNRVLMVMNTAHGMPELLPFDLRGHRVMTFRAGLDQPEHAEGQEALVSQLGLGIRALLEGLLPVVGETVTAPSLASQAVTAVETGRPNRANLTRRFSSDLAARLSEAAPDLAKPHYDRPALLDGLRQAVPITAEFARVASAAAEMNDDEVAEELMRGLEAVVNRSYLRAGFVGKFWNHQFDFYRFSSWELLLILVACLLRERRWEILGRVLTTRLYVRRTAFENSPEHVGIEYFGLDIQTLTGTTSVSEIGDTLRELSLSNPLTEVITFEELQAADYLLFLRLDLPSPQASEWPRWYTWAGVLLSDPPRFLIDAIRMTEASQLGETIGVPGAALVQERLVERGRRFVKYYAIHAHRLSLFPSFDFSTIGSGH